MKYSDIFFCAFVAESVLLVHDFGNVFERVVPPAVSDAAVTLLDGVLVQNKIFVNCNRVVCSI